jgi:hypothetical protein
MTLAGTYLLFWEYDRLKALIFSARPLNSNILSREKWLLPLIFASGTTIMLLIMIGLGIANLHKVPVVKLIPLIAGGAVFGLIVYWHHLKMKTGTLEKPEIK